MPLPLFNEVILVGSGPSSESYEYKPDDRIAACSMMYRILPPCTYIFGIDSLFVDSIIKHTPTIKRSPLVVGFDERLKQVSVYVHVLERENCKGFESRTPHLAMLYLARLRYKTIKLVGFDSFYGVMGKSDKHLKKNSDLEWFVNNHEKWPLTSPRYWAENIRKMKEINKIYGTDFKVWNMEENKFESYLREFPGAK